jgi:hypothetical protein
MIHWRAKFHGCLKDIQSNGQFDSNGKQDFRAEIKYQSLEAPGKICFCGETVATAISLQESLNQYLPWAVENGT